MTRTFIWGMMLVFSCGSCVIIPDEELSQDIQSCICVPYWQCKDDHSGLVEDGVDLMDIRIHKPSLGQNPRCTGEYDVCCQFHCGQRKVPVNLDYDYDPNGNIPRIMGNDEAEFGEFPWMLGILKDKVFRCGASLIHPQVALTAAHCVIDNGPYKVRAGEWNWRIANENLPHQDRMTEKVIIHSNFHYNNLQNDVALLILDSPFALAENVGIICLPPSGISYEGSRCTASGWGKNTYFQGTYQATLKKIDLPIVSRNSCLHSLRSASLGPFFNLHRSFICAGGGRNKDTCKGDGGSPLFCPIEGQPNRYEQVGIVSWGLVCGKYDTPGIYASVAVFSEWIDETMIRHNFDTNIYRY